jgi:tetratricopeptide (TPR) repeat protein
MRWQSTEYILKGVFLGLLLFAALQEPDWPKTGLIAICLGCGLAAGLIMAAITWRRRGVRIGGQILAYVLFLLLESPKLIYAGLLGGLIGGIVITRGDELAIKLLAGCLAAGGVIGLALGELRQLRYPYARLGVALGVAAALTFAALVYLENTPDLIRRPRMLGVHLLLGLPFFYLLVFAGEAEESEAEIAAICASMAVGVWLLQLTPTLPAVGLLLPLGIYYVYTVRVLPGLRVFKHVLRGYSYYRMGRIRDALRSFHRAVELDPKNATARKGLASVHRGIDPRKLAGDTETLALIDLDLCVDRAAGLLWESAPTADQLDEARQLLDLVESQRPAKRPEVEYWRAIAAMRAKRPDQAAGFLNHLLDPSAWTAIEAPARQSVLLLAWQLALLRSSDLAARAGHQQLALPDRRMEAIAAAERCLAFNAKDADAWELKRVLYDKITVADYDAAPPKADGAFDFGYVRELALALLNDPARWRRGVEYLRLAAKGPLATRPMLYTQIAQVLDQAGDNAGALQALEGAKQAGREAGPENLPPDEKQAYFAALKRLGEDAANRHDYRAAVENYTLFTANDRSGIETWRILAEFYERLGDALAALQATEHGLTYNPRDPNLLERKDKYYFSVPLDAVRQASDAVRQGMDFNYCVTKARQVLDSRGADLDSITWAEHLAQLAVILRPDSFQARVLSARALLWRGERESATAILQGICDPKPERFGGSDEEDAWYLSNRLLGNIYLELSRPDLAVVCFEAFRESTKSGAETYFKLGQAYEQLGDFPKAIRWYDQVTAYTDHPKYYDAKEALRRLRGG